MRETVPPRTASIIRGVLMAKVWIALLAIVLTCASTGLAQKKSKEPATRSVSGVVTNAEDAPVAGAAVQLKDTKTKQVRSFYSQEKGEYYFHGLSPDVDYEVSATYKDASSGTRTLSLFDTRKDAVLNLKLAPNKK